MRVCEAVELPRLCARRLRGRSASALRAGRAWHPWEMGRAVALGLPLVVVAEIAVFVLVGSWIGYGWALLAVLAA